MSNLFLVIAIIGWIIGIIFGIKSLTEKQFKRGFRRIGIGVLVTIISFVAFGISSDHEDKVAKENAAAIAKYHATPEYKAKVAKEKADAIAKQQAETQKKAQEEADAIAKQQAEAQKKAQEEAAKKVELQKEFQDKIMKPAQEYLDGFSSNGKSFQGIMEYLGKGGTDYQGAYNNLQTLQSNYQSYKPVSIEPLDSMSDKDKKLLSDFVQNMDTAFYEAKVAAGSASDVVNNFGFAQPSQVKKINKQIANAGNFYQQAQINLTMLKLDLGIK